MRLLDRYLLAELLVPLGYCVGGFLILWVAFDLFGHLDSFQGQGLGLGGMARYYLLVTPEFLVLILPLALLLALLYTLTNLARHHEITAIRAAGVSLWRLSLPYFGVGLLISAASFALNELWVPDSSEEAEYLLNPPKPGGPGRNQVRALGFSNTSEGRRWLIGLYNTETGEMVRPEVSWLQPDGSRLLLQAERGVRTNGVWTFYGVIEHKETGPTNSDLVPILKTNVLAVPAFAETPEQINSEILVGSSMSLRTAKKADIPIREIQNYLRLHPRPAKADASWLYTKLQGRWAAPWTCLVVVLIALPFGAASGRRNVFVGVASSIVICFSYFVLQQLGLALGTGGYLPPWLAAWSPNLSFALAGLWLTLKVR